MKTLKIGIAGLGNVGRGTYEILEKDSNTLSQRTTTNFEVIAVSARSKKDFIKDGIIYYKDPLELANNKDIDIIIEAIGGYDIAKDLIILSLKNNKKVITANKALIA